MTRASRRLPVPTGTVILVAGLFLVLAALVLAPSPMLLLLLPALLFELLPLPEIGKAQVASFSLPSASPVRARPAPRSPPPSIASIRDR